ncbi:hypothetical protein M3204_15160 [Mesobacillus subterraneus]|nr:hypothetical protein [Mesobacillus subterraneus]
MIIRWEYRNAEARWHLSNKKKAREILAFFLFLFGRYDQSVRISMNNSGVYRDYFAAFNIES